MMLSKLCQLISNDVDSFCFGGLLVRVPEIFAMQVRDEESDKQSA